MNTTNPFTNLVSKALDTCGYSVEMVELRRSTYNSLSEFMSTLCNKLGLNGSWTLSGSKREGLSGILQGDIDIMLTLHGILCTDTTTRAGEDASYVFKLDQDGVAPGYTNLRLLNVGRPSCSLIDESLFMVPSKGLYMSSSFLMSKLKSEKEHDLLLTNSFISTLVKNKPQSGPSLPSEAAVPGDLGHADADYVIAFPCECSHYLISWLERPRKYEWPSEDLIQIVATLDSHVVPVGAKGSPDEFSQWRICYTHAEIELMQSLEETHWKLYALLRMFKDGAFQFAEGVITSYVLKNLVMWMAESNPARLFQIHFLLDRLTQTLRVLRLCVRKAFLPSYMIHERNLFQGRLEPDVQSQLLHVLDELILEGPSMVWRCKSLQKNMDMLVINPDMNMNLLEQHNDHEKLALSLQKCMTKQQPELIIKAATIVGEENMRQWMITIIRQLLNDHRIKQMIYDMGHQYDAQFGTALTQLSKDKQLFQNFIESMPCDKRTVEDAKQALSNPQIDQGIYRPLKEQFETEKNQDCLRIAEQDLISLAGNSDISKRSATDITQYMLSRQQDLTTDFHQKIIAAIGTIPELRGAVSKTTSSMTTFIVNLLENFSFGDIGRMYRDCISTGTKPLLECLQRR